MLEKDSHDDLSVPNSIKQSAYNWCLRYRSLFEEIESDEAVKTSLKKYSGYTRPTENLGLIKVLHNCMHKAYESGVVIPGYGYIIETAGLAEEAVFEPTPEWAESLTDDQLLACIAWHFRRDYFNNGSWISNSVANGYMLILVRNFLEKYQSV